MGRNGLCGGTEPPASPVIFIFTRLMRACVPNYCCFGEINVFEGSINVFQSLHKAFVTVVASSVAF